MDKEIYWPIDWKTLRNVKESYNPLDIFSTIQNKFTINLDRLSFLWNIMNHIT